LKLGIDVSATTIATVLRHSGLGPAPRRIGPTWRQFLRVQAYGLMSREPRSDEQDRLSDLEWAPREEAPAPPSDDPATTADVEPIHDSSRPNGERIRTVVARPRGLVIPVPPGARARDGPAMAA
jgi:hypothetical protein